MPTKCGAGDGHGRRARATSAGDDVALQLLVARKTGNFERGNER